MWYIRVLKKLLTKCSEVLQRDFVAFDCCDLRYRRLAAVSRKTFGWFRKPPTTQAPHKDRHCLPRTKTSKAPPEQAWGLSTWRPWLWGKLSPQGNLSPKQGGWSTLVKWLLAEWKKKIGLDLIPRHEGPFLPVLPTCSKSGPGSRWWEWILTGKGRSTRSAQSSASHPRWYIATHAENWKKTAA